MESPASRSHDIRALAFHEAGHVVVGTRLGLAVRGTDLDRDGQGGRGHTHFAPPGPWFQPGAGGLDERERALIERVVTTFLAGFAAEVRLGSADPEGSGWDLDLAIREWLGHLEPSGPARREVAQSLFARAQAILDDPDAWADVERVATALIAKGRLDGVEARSLVRPPPP